MTRLIKSAVAGKPLPCPKTKNGLEIHARFALLLLLTGSLVFLPAFARLAPDIAQRQLAPISSPAAADLCLPLLKSISLSPDAAARRTQRPAGHAAARASVLGLAFGVHYALGPVEYTGTDKAGPSPTSSAFSVADGHALAVSRYRACQKRQALDLIRTGGSSPASGKNAV